MGPVVTARPVIVNRLVEYAEAAEMALRHDAAAVSDLPHEGKA
jgi:hypothetical protein